MKTKRAIGLIIILLIPWFTMAGTPIESATTPPTIPTPATVSKFVDATIFKKLILLREVEKLNDIMLYEYVQEYAAIVAEDAHQKEVISGYIMGELGYNVILAGDTDNIGVYAYSTKQVYDRNFIRFENRQYFLISSNSKQIEQATSLAMLKGFKRGDKDFCFSCNELPDYSGYTDITKTLEFKHKNKTYKYELTSYKELVDMYNKQPNLGLEHVFTDHFKGYAVEQLISYIKHDVRKMSTEEGVAFILSFTRTAFTYKADKEAGAEVYLNPEQTLFSDYSDCEDRAALAYYIIKAVYDLPTVVVEFKSHVGLAVQLPYTIEGANIIEHDGLKYYYIEATGPDNSLKLGEMPSTYIGKNYTINLTYHP